MSNNARKWSKNCLIMDSNLKAVNNYVCVDFWEHNLTCKCFYLQENLKIKFLQV